MVYGFYQSDFAAPTYPEYAYAGFFTASHSSRYNQDLVRVGTEYRFDERDAISVKLQLADPSGDTVFGILTQANGGEESPFSVRESTNSQLPTELATLPGAYAVQARSASGSFKASDTVDAHGRLSIASGLCSIETSLSPRLLGNLYDVVAIVSSGCQLGEGSYTAHALQAYGLSNLYVFLTAPGRNGIMLLLYQSWGAVRTRQPARCCCTPATSFVRRGKNLSRSKRGHVSIATKQLLPQVPARSCEIGRAHV